MANQIVAGETYESITGQLFELGRQLRQPTGYPFDPEQLKRHLQDAIEGRFNNAVQAGKPLTKKPEIFVPVSNIITIDRSQPFSPARFIGEGWKVWRGPVDDNGLEGEEEQDGWSLALTEVDLSQVRFETMLRPNETRITGEEKLKRLKQAGYIRLDAKVLQTLWQDKSLIPESWKEKVNGNIRCIFFDGTVLRSPDGRRSVLYLYWRGGQWYWYYSWLGRGFDASNPSAVLASSK